MSPQFLSATAPHYLSKWPPQGAANIVINMKTHELIQGSWEAIMEIIIQVAWSLLLSFVRNVVVFCQNEYREQLFH